MQADEELAERHPSRPAAGYECREEQGGCDGVPQCPVRLASADETFHLRGEFELRGEGGEAVLCPGLQVSRQAQVSMRTVGVSAG